MKSLILAAAIASASGAAMAQVSARIEIGQPGFYGAIDIGDDYRPRLYAPQPVIIERHEHYVEQPVYLRVPPGHRKNWRKHCRRYDACGRRVLFVRDDWYTNTWAPRYREAHGYSVHQPYVVREPARRVVERRVVERHYVDRRDDGWDKHDRRDKHWDKHDKRHGKGHGNGKHKD